MLVKCPSVQWQSDGLTIHTQQLFLGAGFLGALPISLNQGGEEGTAVRIRTSEPGRFHVPLS